MMTTSNEHNNAPAVPQGWKLVPIEPTLEMMSAAVSEICYKAPGGFTRIDGPGRTWAAMLAATPAPAPAQESVLTDEEIFKCVQAACLDGSCPDFETFTKQELEDPVLTDFARSIIAALRAKGAV